MAQVEAGPSPDSQGSRAEPQAQMRTGEPPCSKEIPTELGWPVFLKNPRNLNVATTLSAFPNFQSNLPQNCKQYGKIPLMRLMKETGRN